MSRGRRRKIEVPTGDAQPQFELGDTAEDIERREREERDERGLNRSRGTERGGREEGREPGKRREASGNRYGY